MLTKKEQTKIWEWLRPDCTVFKWHAAIDPDNEPVWIYKQDGKISHQCPSIYKDGKPDMNTWHYECVPKLRELGWHVVTDSCYPEYGYHFITHMVERDYIPGVDRTIIKSFTNPHAGHASDDPYEALTEWLGGCGPGEIA